jgi:hypothetical protein
MSQYSCHTLTHVSYLTHRSRRCIRYTERTHHALHSKESSEMCHKQSSHSQLKFVKHTAQVNIRAASSTQLKSTSEPRQAHSSSQHQSRVKHTAQVVIALTAKVCQAHSSSQHQSRVKHTGSAKSVAVPATSICTLI